jgi:hypothetical protein
LHAGADDPVHLVRTIGRLAQILIELRDEYVDAPRPDTLDQLERRLDELTRLHTQLTEMRHAHDASSASDDPG